MPTIATGVLALGFSMFYGTAVLTSQQIDFIKISHPTFRDRNCGTFARQAGLCSTA